MTLSDYGSIAEIMGMVGMVGSLVYVGYQLQRARLQMKGQASQARTEALMSLWLTTTNREFADVDAKAIDAPTINDLSEVDRRQLNGFMMAWFGFLQNSFYQQKIGLLEDEQVGFLNRLPYFRQQHVREFWQQHKSFGTYPDDFVAHVDAVITQHDSEA